MTSAEIAYEAVHKRQAMQKVGELAAFIELLRDRPIRNVLEIGGMYGGTMWAWSQFAIGKLVCVDLFVLEGRMERAAGFTLVNADSSLASTRGRVEAVLDGEPVDLLFVDGDHRYEAIVDDAANWLPLLSPTGIAGFHDIYHRWIGPGEQHGYHDMWRFWQAQREVSTSYEIYDPQQDWGGIGVLLGPDAQPPATLPPYVLQGTLEPPAHCLQQPRSKEPL